MKTSQAWQTVATREVKVKLADKTFLSGTIFSLLLLLASILIPAWINTGEEEYLLVTSEDRASSLVAAAKEASGPEVKIEDRAVRDSSQAQELVAQGEADAYLRTHEGGWELVFEKQVDQNLLTLMTSTISGAVTAQNAAAQGVDLQSLQEGSQVSSSLLNGEEDKSGLAMLASLVFAFIFYMSSMLFGVSIANSVVEEKQNRIVEIIATAIPLAQLLAGKIIGNIILAIAQIATYALVGLTALQITGAAAEFGWMLPSVGWFALFYVLGFSAIATLWAAVGAMSARTEDINNLSSPLTMLLVVALFVGIYASDIWLKVLSFVPVISSVAMPRRLLLEDVASWEPVLALGLTLLATWLLTVLGARIYRANIMRGGTSVSWKQALGH